MLRFFSHLVYLQLHLSFLHYNLPIAVLLAICLHIPSYKWYSDAGLRSSLSHHFLTWCLFRLLDWILPLYQFVCWKHQILWNITIYLSMFNVFIILFFFSFNLFIIFILNELKYVRKMLRNNVKMSRTWECCDFFECCV